MLILLYLLCVYKRGIIDRLTFFQLLLEWSRVLRCYAIVTTTTTSLSFSLGLFVVVAGLNELLLGYVLVWPSTVSMEHSTEDFSILHRPCLEISCEVSRSKPY